INRVTARKGMVAGAVAFFLILHVFSLYVWSVEVSGCKEIPQEQVIGAARELGLAPGSLKSGVDAEALQQQLMLKFPDVAWLSVNTRGSDVVIVLEEKKKNPEIVTENKVANIKAAESGQILRMEVYRGQAQVKVGDAVVKGQLLISGIVENADGNSQMVRASGRIVAATERSFTARIPLKQTVETDEGRRVVRRSIRVFGVELPLTLTAAPKGNFKREYRRENVRGVTGVLPVSLFTETWTERTTKEVALTEQQAREQAERNLSEMLKSLSDTTILSSEKKGEVKDGAYVLTFTCKCEQNIAVESEILFK
ncbi:MAG TPA: sporulation protein, partial [Ruminococcaceae bacterium]|nr:sporulation protein [Oscillospiraceae bacterium]